MDNKKNALKNDLKILNDELNDIDGVKHDLAKIDNNGIESDGFVKVLLNKSDFDLLKDTAKSVMDIEIKKFKHEYDIMEFGYNALMKFNQRYRGIEDVLDDLKEKSDIVCFYLNLKDLVEDYQKYYDYCIEEQNEEEAEY